VFRTLQLFKTSPASSPRLTAHRLLPTNCLRACTASPTEISYNHSDDPAALYRAEVEFITAEDWIRELQVLFTDLIDGNGEIFRESNSADSDAGVALAKLRAVYPSKTKAMLVQGSPEAFANEPAVRCMLGTVKYLQSHSANGLYHQLQRFVDSKEKSTETKRKVKSARRKGKAKSSIDNGRVKLTDTRLRDDPTEFWPLIKVVRIYTKASALSTGAVIVDLVSGSLPAVTDQQTYPFSARCSRLKRCPGSCSA